MNKRPRARATENPIRADIVLVDVIGYSKLTDSEQFQTVQAIQGALEEQISLLPALSGVGEVTFVIGIIPTGDGFYLILHPAISGYGVLLAISTRSILLTQASRTASFLKGLRFAIHRGRALPYKDMTGMLNFVGGGLNDCARLLSLPLELVEGANKFCGGENFIIASEEALASFDRAYPPSDPEVAAFLEIVEYKTSAGCVVTDKHGYEHPYRVVRVNRTFAIHNPRADQMPHEEARWIDDMLRRMRG